MKAKECQILGPCQRTKKNLWDIQLTVIPIVDGSLGTVSKRVERTMANQRKNRNHLDYNIVEIGSNNMKSLGELRTLAAVNQTPVKKPPVLAAVEKLTRIK